MNGLNQWDELSKMPDSQKNLIRSVVVFQSNGRSNSFFLITSDDEVYGLGVNGSDTNILGLTGPHYECERVERPVLVESLSGKNIIKISVGDNVGAALDCKGDIYWWGNCDEVDDEIMLPHPPSLKTKFIFTQVTCGSRFMAALNQSGNVYVWGKLKADGTSTFMRKVILHNSLHINAVMKLSSGKTHLAMLTTSGAVLTWGCNDSAQRGFVQNHNVDENAVEKLQFDQPCKDVVCGVASTICLTSSGDVWACGEKSKLWGAHDEESDSSQLKMIQLSSKIIQLIVGWCEIDGTYQSIYVATAIDGRQFVWNDITGPGGLLNTPSMEIFLGRASPRDKMVTIMQPPPKQHHVKCWECKTSDKIQFVLNSINEKFSILGELTTEMVQDLQCLISEGRVSQLFTKHSTAATQTDECETSEEP